MQDCSSKVDLSLVVTRCCMPLQPNKSHQSPVPTLLSPVSHYFIAPFFCVPVHCWCSNCDTPITLATSESTQRLFDCSPTLSMIESAALLWIRPVRYTPQSINNLRDYGICHTRRTISILRSKKRKGSQRPLVRKKSKRTIRTRGNCELTRQLRNHGKRMIFSGWRKCGCDPWI